MEPAVETTPLEREFAGLTEKYITPQANAAREAAETARDIQKQLLSLMERDTSPTDTKVQDLEAQLDDVREDIRQIRVDMKGTVAAPERREAPNFKGMIVREIAKIQAAVKQYGSFEQAMNLRAIDTSDIATAGKLGPDLENQFLNWLIEKQQALSRVQVRRMTASSARLDELLVGTRKLRLAVEATAPSLTDAVTFAKRDLSSKEVIWAEDISLSFLEDNIERDDAEDTISRALAVGFGNDSNDLFWNGDEDNSDDFLGINDGIIDIAKADGNVVDYDATSDTTVQAILAGSLRALPVDYANYADLAYFTPYKTALSYADEIADRKTVMGDGALVNGVPMLRYFGIPVIGESHLNTSSADEGVLTLLRNLVWGVQRGITLESQWQPRKRAVEITISARTDQNYAKSQALVLIDGIAADLR